jgi:hypothetical protein
MEPGTQIQKSGQCQAPTQKAPDISLREDSHPLHVGDVVAVLALDQAGHPVLEGQATIIAGCPPPHIYRVRFQDEKRSCVRFVDPNWQAQPDRALALLRDFWRSNSAVNPQVDDFFPPDSSEFGGCNETP